MSRSGRPYPLHFYLLAAILGLAVAVLLLELALRLFSEEVRQYERVQRRREEAQRDSIWQASDDPVLIYEHRPNYRKDGRVLTEGNGILRAEQVSRQKPASVFRIAVLGDSIAAGLYLDPSQTFPVLLESALNSNYGASGRNVEVLNFAVNGYRSVQEARLLELRAAEFSPDLIVLQYCLNDVANSYTPTIWFQEPPAYRMHLVRRAVKLLKTARGFDDPLHSRLVPKFGPEYGTLDYWLRLYDEQSASWQSVVGALESVAEYTKKRNIPGIVVVFPLFLEDDWQRSTVIPFHRQVVRAAEDAGLAVLDLLDVFGHYDVPALRLKEKDIYHPNGVGHRLAAEELAKRVMQLGEGMPSKNPPDAK